MSGGQTRALILASTSPYRRELLARLGLPFEVMAPQVKETRGANEPADALVRRLSVAKARAIKDVDALVIGSDQVAVVGDSIVGKPGDHATATAQLRRAAGQRVSLLTGLCLRDAATGSEQVDVITYAVVFRQLTDAQIERYLQREQPYNCAGSFKSEGLGVALFERMEGDDPSALMGLPLIRLVRMLESAGVAVP